MAVKFPSVTSLKAANDNNDQEVNFYRNPPSPFSVIRSGMQNKLQANNEFLLTQTHVSSLSTTLFSQMRQSQTSIESQASGHSHVSIASEQSLQSQLSAYSKSSLGFLPCLGCFRSNGEGSPAGDYQCISTLKGHDGYVSALALIGELLYSGSSSNDIRVWLGADLTEYCKFGSGDGVVKALVAVGDKIYSAHQDHKIRVWRRSRQQEKVVHKLLATIPTVKDYVASLLPPTKFVQVRRHKKRLWIEHIDTISVLAICKRNNVLYSGSWDRSVKVWRLSDFKCLESFKAHDDAITAIVLSVDGYVYTASADAKVKVWLKGIFGDKKKGKHSLITTLEIHKSAVNALTLSSDGSLLYSGGSDRAIVVWEREISAQHMTAVGALRGHRHAVLCMAAVGEIVCSGSTDKTIRVWRRESGTIHSCLAVLRGHNAPIKCIHIGIIDITSKIGYMVYSGSLDREIKAWCVSAYRCPRGEDDTSSA